MSVESRGGFSVSRSSTRLCYNPQVGFPCESATSVSDRVKYINLFVGMRKVPTTVSYSHKLAYHPRFITLQPNDTHMPIETNRIGHGEVTIKELNKSKSRPLNSKHYGLLYFCETEVQFTTDLDNLKKGAEYHVVYEMKEDRLGEPVLTIHEVIDDSNTGKHKHRA